MKTNSKTEECIKKVNLCMQLSKSSPCIHVKEHWLREAALYIEDARAYIEDSFYRQKEFTLSELSKFNGRNGNPAYIAVSGIVYDVTWNRTWSAGTHFGLYAGRDLTKEFAGCHSKDILSKLPQVGTLKQEV